MLEQLVLSIDADGDTFIVLDAFPLPVQGTETRVNAGNEGNEFAVQYMEGSNAVSQNQPRLHLIAWLNPHTCRSAEKKTLWGGIIRIQATAAGFLESMFLPK